MKGIAAIFLFVFATVAAANEEVCLPNQCWAYPIVVNGQYLACVRCESGQPSVSTPADVDIEDCACQVGGPSDGLIFGFPSSSIDFSEDDF